MTKKLALIFLLCMLIIFVLACVPSANQDYFFVEIMADGLKTDDELVAKQTAAAIYSYLAATLNDCDSLLDTESAVTQNLSHIEYIANDILSQLQVSYKASAEIAIVQRQSRQCGNIVVGKGAFKTLIVTLGEGGGATNFSLLYPSLTYVDGEKEIVLRSKIMEIMEENKGKCKEQKN